MQAGETALHAGGQRGVEDPQLVAASAETGPHEAELEVPVAREALELPFTNAGSGPARCSQRALIYCSRDAACPVMPGWGTVLHDGA